MPPRDSPGGILSFELLCFSYHIYFNFIKLSCFSLSLIFPQANQDPTPQNEIYPAPYPPRMFSLPSGTLPLHGSCHARQIEFPFPALHNTSFIISGNSDLTKVIIILIPGMLIHLICCPRNLPLKGFSGSQAAFVFIWYCLIQCQKIPS